MKLTYTRHSSVLNAPTPPGNNSAPARALTIVCFGSCSCLEAVTIREVFRQTNDIGQAPSYRIQVVTNEQLGNRYEVESHSSAPTWESTTDTLVVVAPGDVRNSSLDREHLAVLRELCSRSRRVVAVAGGTIVLAATGLLDGCKVVAHWALRDSLKRFFPRVLLESDGLYVSDGNIVTCAGGLASADLALKLLEEDLGRKAASVVARRLLLHFRRSGNSRQISYTLQAQAAASDPIFDLLAWLPDHLREDLSVTSLARRTAMSPRNFARTFRSQTGTTPARYVECLRFEAAERELASNQQTVARVAESVGLTNTEALRRLFQRHLGITPRRFRGTSPAPPGPALNQPHPFPAPAASLEMAKP